jgi:hypothetical protein
MRTSPSTGGPSARPITNPVIVGSANPVANSSVKAAGPVAAPVAGSPTVPPPTIPEFVAALKRPIGDVLIKTPPCSDLPLDRSDLGGALLGSDANSTPRCAAATGT